jgi:hypothetical protein
VVCRRLRLALATVCGSHDVPHAGATCFLIVATVIVDCGRNPLRMLLAPLIASLGALLGVMDGFLNNASLPLLEVASLLLGVGQSLVVSLPVPYWTVTPRNSLMVQLKMPLGAWKGNGCCASHMSLLGPFALAPWGHSGVPSSCCVRPGVSPAHDVWAAHAHPPGEPVSKLGVR